MLFGKIPRFIEDKSIRLRPPRFVDAKFLLQGFKNEHNHFTDLGHKTLIPQRLSVWWWMKKTFSPAYCIERASNPIGFIGLYNLILGKSAEMSLIIFDDNFRGLGYGTRAFKLLAQNLKECSTIKKIFVRVRADNYRTLSFWKKLGFMEAGIHNGIITMSMDLCRGCL